jgi:ADP-L-glycero-D-manno-heptose 6-epimerase
MGNFLVTGGSGFIGSNLVKRLVQLGHWVYYTGKIQGENKVQATFIGTDFNDIDFDNLPKIDTVFHQAAITDTLVNDRQKMFNVNTYHSMQLFEAAIKAGCKTIVYASSCAVYGNVEPPFKEKGPFCPLNVYAESKLALDLLAPGLLDSNVSITGLRYSNVYGAGEWHKGHASSMIYQMIKKTMAKEKPRLFKYGQQARDWVDVEDVVNLNLLAAEAKVSGVFNGGSGYALSFNDVFKAIKEEMNSDLEIDYIDNNISSAYQELTVCDMSKSENLGHKVKTQPTDGIKRYTSLIKHASIIK